ncbi:uncharacterized protein LOC128200323 [Galleria mellonella]|uniref:Uncharacterized protein LOC128200323 n=1 Tax=Galleria mellonella TaxID=7137 RepID=A0ABM3MD93_GALME|nr:uncharacterized protein LOC128200323 [Galleria mellonella]
MSRELIVLYIVLLVAVSVHGRPKSYVYKNATMPENCQRNYCFDKSDEYPSADVINSIVNDFNITVHSAYFKQRIGFCSSENSDCELDSHNEPIYEIIDEAGNIRYVVQAEKLKQLINIIECIRPGRLTSDDDALHFSATDLSKLSCEETYIEYEFLVFTQNGGIENAKVKDGLPVCCSCRYIGNNS